MAITTELRVPSATKFRTIAALQTAICKGLRTNDQEPFDYYNFATPAVRAALSRVGVSLDEPPVSAVWPALSDRKVRLRFLHNVLSAIRIAPPIFEDDRGVVLVAPKVSFVGDFSGASQQSFCAAVSKLMALGLVEGLAKCEQFLRMRAVQDGEAIDLATSNFMRNRAEDFALNPEAPWCDLDGLARTVEVAVAAGVDVELLKPQLFCFKARDRKSLVAQMIGDGVLKVTPPDWWRQLRHDSRKATAFSGVHPAVLG